MGVLTKAGVQMTFTSFRWRVIKNPFAEVSSPAISLITSVRYFGSKIKSVESQLCFPY